MTQRSLKLLLYTAMKKKSDIFQNRSVERLCGIAVKSRDDNAKTVLESSHASTTYRCMTLASFFIKRD